MINEFTGTILNVFGIIWPGIDPTTSCVISHWAVKVVSDCAFWEVLNGFLLSIVYILQPHLCSVFTASVFICHWISDIWDGDQKCITLFIALNVSKLADFILFTFTPLSFLILILIQCTCVYRISKFSLLWMEHLEH